MRNADQAVPAKVSRWRAYTWSVLAALTCPCHLLMVALLLSGTAAGALIIEHMGVALLALTILFALFLRAALRAFRRPP